jgi:Tfp pilus assembly protein PilW
MMVALGIFSICGLAMTSLYVFASRSLVSLANYAQLDISNRQAMDTLTAEIREATQVIDYTTNADMASITVISGSTNSHTVTYLFTRASKQLVRNDATDGSRKVLLNNCSLLNFDLRQRNPYYGNFDIYPVATNDWQHTVKVIQLTWKTSIMLPNGVGNSENIQTARVVIRKQQDS